MMQVGGARCGIEVMDDIESHADASIWCGDSPRVEDVNAIMPHQQFDMCLKCLGQTLSDMSDMSGVTDPHLESGMFLSGSGIIVWRPSGHRLISLHQTTVRCTTDTQQVLPSFVFSSPQITADIAILNV